MLNLKKGDPLVVTTARKGVFYGRYVTHDETTRTIELEGIRMALYWSEKVSGFLGLAKTGPLGDSRISEQADRSHLNDYTSITKCTDEAAKTWEKFKAVGK